MAVVSLVARLSAQSAEFEKTFSKASQTASQFEKQYGSIASSVSAHQARINKAFQSFSGDKIIAEANEYASAIARVGGAAKLTEAEQRRVNATVTEAIAKYQALGQVAPHALTELAKATSQVPAAIGSATRSTSLFGESLDRMGQRSGIAGAAMGVLGSTIGKFTIAGLAVSVVNNLTGALAGFASKGSALGPLQKSFENLTASVGQNSGEMLSKMQDATRGLVSNYDLMQSANKAVLLGLPVTSNEMGELAKTARVLGKAMGLDATQSLNDLVTALGRSSPLILDNLGLTVKVGEANEKYAAALGKTEDALTDAERKTAFYNAAMEAARRKTQELGDQTPTATELASSAWTSFGNVVTSTVSIINREIGALISDTASAASNVAKTLSDLRNQGIRGAIMSAFTPQMTARVNQPTAPATTAPPVPADYIAKVKEATDRVNELTKAQRDQITAAELLGGSALKELMARYQLTDVHLKVLSQTTKDAAAATQKATKATEEAEKQQQKMADALQMVGELQSRTINNLAAGAEDLTSVWKSMPGKDVGLPILPWFVQLHDAVKEFRESTVSSLAAGVNDLAFVFNSLPGKLIDIKIPSFPPSVMQQLFDPKSLGQALGNAVSQAIQSGGDIFASAAGAIGQHFTTGLAKHLTASVADGGKAIGGFLGGAINSVLPGIGALLGPLVGKITSALSNAFGIGTGAGRQVVEDFAAGFRTFNLDTLQFDSGGGFDQLRAKLADLGAEGEKLWKALTQGVGRNNPEQARAVIDAINAALARHAQALDESAVAATAAGAAEDAAFSGLKARLSELGAEFDNLNEWVSKEAPEAEMGKLEEVARARMAAIEEEKSALQQKADEDLRVQTENQKRIELETQQSHDRIQDFYRENELEIPYRFKPMNQLPAGAGGGFDVPALASGGIVRRPTLALIGEKGPEAVIPLSKLGGSGDGRPMLIQLLLPNGQVFLEQFVKAKRELGLA